MGSINFLFLLQVGSSKSNLSFDFGNLLFKNIMKLNNILVHFEARSWIKRDYENNVQLKLIEAGKADAKYIESLNSRFRDEWS